jgi:hypothetical protein
MSIPTADTGERREMSVVYAAKAILRKSILKTLRGMVESDLEMQCGC